MSALEKIPPLPLGVKKDWSAENLRATVDTSTQSVNKKEEGQHLLEMGARARRAVNGLSEAVGHIVAAEARGPTVSSAEYSELAKAFEQAAPISVSLTKQTPVRIPPFPSRGPEGHWTFTHKSFALAAPFLGPGEKGLLPQGQSLFPEHGKLFRRQRDAAASVDLSIRNKQENISLEEHEMLVDAISQTFLQVHWAYYKPVVRFVEAFTPSIPEAIEAMKKIYEYVDCADYERICTLTVLATRLERSLTDRKDVPPSFALKRRSERFCELFDASFEGIGRIGRKRAVTAARLFEVCGATVYFHAPKKLGLLQTCLSRTWSNESQVIFDSLLTSVLDLSLNERFIPAALKEISTARQWITSGLRRLAKIDQFHLCLFDAQLERLDRCLFRGDLTAHGAGLFFMTFASMDAFDPTWQRGAKSDGQAQSSMQEHPLKIRIDHLLGLFKAGSSATQYSQILCVLHDLEHSDSVGASWSLIADPLLKMADALDRRRPQKASKRALRLFAVLCSLQETPADKRVARAWSLLEAL